MNKKNLLYIILIILVTAIYYYYQGQEAHPEAEPQTDLTTQPIYQSDKMQTLIYNLSGKLSYKITSQHAEYLENTKEAQFTAPFITLYNQNNNASWNITSNFATLTNDKKLILKGDVKLDNLLPDNQIQSILTNNANVDLITQIVTSNEKVTIQGTSFSSTGYRLYGNLREKKADILENVKTYYNTTTLTTPNN
ncbi:LPS export ABC transporter periplasmic protein LptC [Orbaceae bacterium ac157xtp]